MYRYFPCISLSGVWFHPFLDHPPPMDFRMYLFPSFSSECSLIVIFRTQAKTWLTTGWHTMLLALDMCEDLTVYGMVYGDYCL